MKHVFPNNFEVEQRHRIAAAAVMSKGRNFETWWREGKEVLDRNAPNIYENPEYGPHLKLMDRLAQKIADIDPTRDVANGTSPDNPMFRVRQPELLEGCRALLELNENPQPGLHVWNTMCANAVDLIRAALGPPEPACKKADLGYTVSWQTYVNGCQAAFFEGKNRVLNQIKKLVHEVKV